MIPFKNLETSDDVKLRNIRHPTPAFGVQESRDKISKTIQQDVLKPEEKEFIPNQRQQTPAFGE